MQRFQPGQIVENVLVNGRVIVVRVIEELTRPGLEGHYRVTDARETDSNADLIRTDRTWGAPVENLRVHDEECYVCHKSGLVHFG